jgi:hypothetical protein
MVNRLLVATLPLALLVASACGGGNSSSKPAASAPSTAAEDVKPTPTGPRASIEPRSGPAGSPVIVTGSGWPPGAPLMVTAKENPTNAAPYAQLTTAADGSFVARFRLEKAPDGTSLKVGRFDLIARSTNTQVVVPFQVESPRPVRNAGDGG